MITTDEELRQAYLSQSREAMSGDHLDSEQLWRLAAGELGASESRASIDHISGCPACAEDFRLTRQLVAEATDEMESAADRTAEHLSESAAPESGSPDRSVVPFPQRTRSSRWLRHLAAAAAVVVVAGGLGWQLIQSEDPVFRQGAEEVVQTLIDADFAAPRQDARLRWRGPEGAVYDVIVTTAALQVVFEAEGLESTELLIPQAELRELPRDTVLRWYVESVLPDGSRVPSESFDLRLADE